MLKKYYAGEDEIETGNKKEDLKLAASAEALLDEKTQNIDEDSLLKLGTYRKKENVSDVKLGTELNDSQSRSILFLI